MHYNQLTINEKGDYDFSLRFSPFSGVNEYIDDISANSEDGECGKSDYDQYVIVPSRDRITVKLQLFFYGTEFSLEMFIEQILDRPFTHVSCSNNHYSLMQKVD